MMFILLEPSRFEDRKNRCSLCDSPDAGEFRQMLSVSSAHGARSPARHGATAGEFFSPATPAWRE
ncbi:hypothetical protein [Burkholderia ubonensis]|uniref:hypothetical protein n=1 Tax=Burkholderia ubonensis TaxID=101571 RepID=UPI0010563403|nr:hypothetical protein [Burkholderia ubonensis]